MVTIALAGNPNSGKTTLFNTLTGSKQHVGNWPGKTVERKEGTFNLNNKKINIIDLPGTYSLTSFSAEETVTRDFIMKAQPDIVIDVIDATNLQRNLYLALELLELNANLILAINMDKFAKRKGIHIDTKKIQELLNVPIIKVNAREKEETENLINQSLNHKKKSISVQYGDEIEEHLKDIESLIKINLKKITNYSPRWLAVKLLEQDSEVINIISKEENGNKVLEELNIIIIQ